MRTSKNYAPTAHLPVIADCTPMVQLFVVISLLFHYSKACYKNLLEEHCTWLYSVDLHVFSHHYLTILYHRPDHLVNNRRLNNMQRMLLTASNAVNESWLLMKVRTENVPRNVLHFNQCQIEFILQSHWILYWTAGKKHMDTTARHAISNPQIKVHCILITFRNNIWYWYGWLRQRSTQYWKSYYLIIIWYYTCD